MRGTAEDASYMTCPSDYHYSGTQYITLLNKLNRGVDISRPEIYHLIMRSKCTIYYCRFHKMTGLVRSKAISYYDVV